LIIFAAGEKILRLHFMIKHLQKKLRFYLTSALLTISISLLTILSLNAQENLYSPDTSMISLDSIDFDSSPEAFDPNTSDFYKTFDTLYIRRHSKDMSYFEDTLLLVLDKNFISPCNGPVISNFGPRHKRIHAGVDIKLNLGDTVYAAFDGVVRISRIFSGYGKFVLIRHESGLETAYGHFSKLLVKPNETVKAGQPIGLGGSTGRATCNHLHFETRMFGEPMNPNMFIDFASHKIKKDSLLITASSFNTGHSYPPKNSSAPHALTASAGVNTYMIRQGDTLYSLAKRYGTTVKVLCDLNNINEKKILRIGQVIKVPVR
jgi:murein DD-endopeptidase MepM/ murein hydrolase activator NlpD